MTQLHTLIPCAGSGSRAGTVQPKQYQTLAGQSLVMHTVQALAQVSALATGWVVISPADAFDWPEAAWPAHFQRIACGGASRAESVLNGLTAMLQSGLSSDDWVLVHDAARCLVEPREVTALIEACREEAVGGLLALPLPDTLKTERIDAGVARVASTVSREGKWLAQTPQMFRLGVLHAALTDAATHGFSGITDEASALERLGMFPRLVAGSMQNFKVTYPADFALAEAILRSRT